MSRCLPNQGELACGPVHTSRPGSRESGSHGVVEAQRLTGKGR